MSDGFSLRSLDGLLLQFVCRAQVAERRSHIETLRQNIKKLEDEILAKQDAVTRKKANAKCMRTTNSLLLQYEQTLKDELESRKASYNHDTEVYEERIARYRKLFQSHREYYCQTPLAQKLLGLQAEKEAIEGRIKACDNEIIMKQTELDHLTDSAVNSSSTEILPDSVSGQEPMKEPKKQTDPQTEEGCSAVDISSLHLDSAMLLNGHKVSVEAIVGDVHEEHKVQDSTTCCPEPEENSSEPWSYDQLDEQRWSEGVRADDQEKEMDPRDQALELQSTEVEEAVEDKVEERVDPNEDQTRKKDKKELIAFSQSSQEKASPAKPSAAPSTPMFQFNFSPSSSPHQGTSDAKSPAFLFSMNSDPTTPGFSGFEFDMDTSQDEETSFAFASPFFSQKKTTESKASDCAEFIFDQSEENEDFQFTFTSKSPQAANKDKSREEFPFSFHF